MKNLLFFIKDEDEPKRKTKRFYVYSKHSNDLLGVVCWKCGWRCYVMEYRNDIIMSIGCHKELNEFMQKLEDERKEKIKNV